LLPRIFDLFVTTKPPGRGTGLGLVICQEIVRAHGGTIAVESSVGRGTLVSICLPVDTRRPTAPGTEEDHERANFNRGR
ncbi:MAG: ATP-binding protein, partial [Deltaproteobacteria bacterium]